MINILKSKLGKFKVSIEKSDKIAYSRDASMLKGNATLVVWPENADDIKEIVRYAFRHKLNVIPRGAGTGLAGGVVPRDSIVLDLSCMNKFKIDFENKVAEIEPGVVLDEFNNASKLKIPVLPGSHAVATIGGMIATNASGLRSFNFGNMCSWVEELEIIGGTGRKIVLKGDEIQDVCGKEGITGIIVKAKVKLIENWKGNSMVFLKFDTVTEMIENYLDLITEDITAIEYINSVAAELAGMEPKEYLIVEFEGDSGTIKGKEMDEIWDIRERIYPAVVSKGFTKVEDPVIPLDNVGKFILWLKKMGIPAYGHIGERILHPHFKDEELRNKMYEVVLSLKGSVSGEHGIGLTKKKFVDNNMQEVLSSLKRKYDPYNAINRGKVINTI